MSFQTLGRSSAVINGTKKSWASSWCFVRDSGWLVARMVFSSHCCPLLPDQASCAHLVMLSCKASFTRVFRSVVTQSTADFIFSLSQRAGAQVFQLCKNKEDTSFEPAECERLALSSIQWTHHNGWLELLSCFHHVQQSHTQAED